MAQRGDPLHQMGCMLYWAEGSRSRNQLAFTNADPEMVDLFVHFLRRCYGVDDERIGLRVNVHLGVLGAVQAYAGLQRPDWLG
jgi:hypothetical protein